MSSGRIPSIEGGIQPTIFDAKADILTATAADTPARLAVGANNTVLTADSTTATGLKWATVSGGGMTQLATGTLSGASLTISSISGSYRDLRLILSNAYPANDAEGFSLRFNSSSTNYFYTSYNSTNVTGGNVFAYTEMTFNGNMDNAATGSLSVIEIPEYAGSTWKMANCISYFPYATTATDINFYKTLFAWNKTDAITSLYLFPTAGNFGGGTYTLYGVS